MAAKKVTPGDGSSLKPYRRWHSLWRSLFQIDLRRPEGGTDTYAVDVDFFAWEEELRLYRNGEQVARAGSPASFPIPGGAIEAATSTYGVRRMHAVRHDGAEKQLTPHPFTGEAWRARLARRHPTLSRVLAGASFTVLAVSLVVLAPQVAEWVSRLPIIADSIGTFTSPIALPPEANIALTVAGVLAGIERAQRLRHHWLLDMDTWWMGE